MINYNKKLGEGMYGTTYLCKYKNNKSACKIEHVLEPDINNKKSKLWQELKFSYFFANKYPDQFITLYTHKFIENCKHKQEYIVDPKFFNSKFRNELKELAKSKVCALKIYSYVDYTLGQIMNSLSKEQIYSFIIQYSYIIHLLETNGYVHGDVHQFNIGVVKTTKKYIKIFKYLVPTFGYIFKLIDFGKVEKVSEKITSTIKKHKNEMDYLMTVLVSNKPFLNYIKRNKIEIDELKVKKNFDKSIESSILNVFCPNEDNICKMYKFNLYKTLFPEAYQRNILGKKFKKVLEPILRVDLADILFIYKSNFNKYKIINYFILKIKGKI
jgi:serine/threonine protein kinase